MWIRVGVLLDLEGLVCSLEHHGNIDVERRVILGERDVVGVLNEATCPLLVEFYVYAVGYELIVELLDEEELTRLVDHRLRLARLVDHKERRDAGSACYAVVIGTEGWCDMHDTRTVRRGYVVAHNHAERVAHRLHPRDELLVADALELLALECQLLDLESALLLLAEVGSDELLGHNDRLTSLGVRILALHANILDRRAYAERRVRRECPRGGRPGEEVELALGTLEEVLALLVAHHAELRRAGRVLHVAVAARLVKLVRRESRSCGR